MLNYEYIDTILNDAAAIPKAAEEFRKNSEDQFNHKPDEAGWSAAECFEHLVIVNDKYLPVFENISKTYNEEPGKKFSNSFIGKFLIKSIHPDARLKVKTSSMLIPIRKYAGEEIIREYLKQHAVIKNYIERFRNYDIKKIKVNSPMSSIIKYNLGDACRIIIYHDLRHLKQARRAAESYLKSSELKVG